MRISDWSSDVCSADLADRFMIRLGHDVSAFAAKASELGAMGRSPLYAAIDGKLAAVIAVADPVKETTPEAIRALHDLGLKVAIITGDNQATADAVARTLDRKSTRLNSSH